MNFVFDFDFSTDFIVQENPAPQGIKLNLGPGLTRLPDGRIATNEDYTAAVGKFANSDDTTDVNPDNWGNVPIFGEKVILDVNFPGNVEDELIISLPEGRWRVSGALYIETFNQPGSVEQRIAPNLRLADVDAGDRIPGTAISGTAYMRFANGHDHSSLHFDELIDVVGGPLRMAIQTRRDGNGGVARMADPGSSQITFEYRL